MNIKTLYSKIAEINYNCNSYGAGAYGECTTVAVKEDVSPGGMLAETGYDVLLPLSLGLAIITASTILLVKKVRRHS